MSSGAGGGVSGVETSLFPQTGAESLTSQACDSLPAAGTGATTVMAEHGAEHAAELIAPERRYFLDFRIN